MAFAMGSHSRLGQYSPVGVLGVDLIEMILSPVTTNVRHLYDSYCNLARESLSWQAEDIYIYSMDDGDDEGIFDNWIDETMHDYHNKFLGKVIPLKKKYDQAINNLQDKDCDGLGTLVDVITNDLESIRSVHSECVDFVVGYAEIILIEGYLCVPRLWSIITNTRHRDSPAAKSWALNRLLNTRECLERDNESCDSSGVGVGYHYARYICDQNFES